MRIERLDDGALRFLDPRGRAIVAPPSTAGTFARLLATNDALGIRIDAVWAASRWRGEDLYLDPAVAALCCEACAANGPLEV